MRLLTVANCAINSIQVGQSFRTRATLVSSEIFVALFKNLYRPTGGYWLLVKLIKKNISNFVLVNNKFKLFCFPIYLNGSEKQSFKYSKLFIDWKCVYKCPFYMKTFTQARQSSVFKLFKKTACIGTTTKHKSVQTNQLSYHERRQARLPNTVPNSPLRKPTVSNS